MKVLLVGSGGREHALAWKLSQAPSLDELHAAPGNPGIAALGQCHPVRRGGRRRASFTSRGALDADLVVVGPEGAARRRRRRRAPACRRPGLRPEPPRRRASKARRRSPRTSCVPRACPTAESLSIARAPCVIKADGLAAGKGVFVCRDQTELDGALLAAAAFGDSIVIEELLEGEEISVFALCDGVRALALCRSCRTSSAQTRATTGPNTGGMGSYSPVPASARPRSRSCSTRSTARCSPSSPRAARLSSACSSQGSCSRRTGHGCSSSTAGSAIQRRSPSCPGSKETCSKSSPPRRRVISQVPT